MDNFPDAVSADRRVVRINDIGRRLSKAVIRTGELSDQLLPRAGDLESPGRQEERRMLFTQLDFVTTRSRLLQRALSRLYADLVFFYAAFLLNEGVALRARCSQHRDGFHLETREGIRARGSGEKGDEAASLVRRSPVNADHRK